MKRAIITFTGRVQGVGFRYTVQSKALDLKLTGSVQNQPDGSVLAIAQGNSETLFKLIQYLSDTFSIEKVEISFKASIESLNDFLITYS